MVGAAIAMVISAGITAYSSYEQGKSQEAIANYNADNQERSTRLGLSGIMAAAQVQRQEAAANFALQGAEAQARFNNAISLENQAKSQSVVDRVNSRQRTDAFAREAAAQRVSIAASGAVESSGTPLDLLAETAGTIQRDREDQNYAAELGRRALFREADLERLGGQMALAGATLQRDSSVAAAGLRVAAGRAASLGAMREAEITRLSGAAQRRAGALGAGASLFGGLASAGGMYYKAS